ncbi:MAG TPA: class I SAM-dependent methyltransferase [Chryseosolibacter sp.]
MSDKFFQAKAYLSYWLDAVDEHSLHSPFFFDFYTRVVKKNKNGTPLEKAENLRTQLLNDHRVLKDADLGSGPSSTKRAINLLARTSLSPMSLSSLYNDTIDFFKAKSVIELGTSFGINTLYLASKKERSVTTFEGTSDVAEIAKLTFEFAQANNIELVQGNLDTTLRAYVQSIRKFDLALMDANHRYEPTLRYFNMLMPKLQESSVVIVDDIHYSREMEKAWYELKNHKLVYGSADLFRCGFLFFDPSLNKQHVILQF